MSNNSITPATLEHLPTDVRKWFSIAFAISMVMGTLTGSIIAIINASNSTAKSVELDPIKAQLDRIEAQQKRTAELARANALQTAHLAAWSCRMNAGEPTPGWPCEGIRQWDAMPTAGLHHAALPWPLPREIVVLGEDEKK